MALPHLDPHHSSGGPQQLPPSCRSRHHHEPASTEQAKQLTVLKGDVELLFRTKETLNKPSEGVIGRDQNFGPKEFTLGGSKVEEEEEGKEKEKKRWRRSGITFLPNLSGYHPRKCFSQFEKSYQQSSLNRRVRFTDRVFWTPIFWVLMSLM